MTFRKSAKQLNLELLKVSKITNLKISNHGEARNIKFGQQVNLIQRAPLDTLPQELVTSLLHNHMILTKLFISSYRGGTVIRFGQ